MSKRFGGAVSQHASCYGCGKKTYGSKKDAKTAKRILHPSEPLHAYECPQVVGNWHLGHLSPAVTSGRLSRSEAYGRG